MTETIKLYNMDLEVQEWRKGNFQRGDHWRSDAIYQCRTCLIQSNDWIMGGAPGMGPRLVCEGTGYFEHDRIEEYLRRKDFLQKLRKDIAEDPLAEHFLREEQGLALAIQNIRTRFGERFNNVQGNPQRIIQYWPSSHIAYKKDLEEAIK